MTSKIMLFFFLKNKFCLFLQEPTFQRLIFITMLAWENPYHDHASVSEEISFQVVNAILSFVPSYEFPCG